MLVIIMKDIMITKLKILNNKKLMVQKTIKSLTIQQKLYKKSYLLAG
jgi:hypothetical protein